MTQETGHVALRRTRKNMPDVALRESFTRSAYHEQYLGQFWSSYLPNGRAFPSRSSSFSTGSWMNELHKRFRMNDESALKQVLLAISLTSVGKRDNKPWLVEKGISYYGSSLATLAQQLETESGPISDSGLATSNLLSLYEVGLLCLIGMSSFLRDLVDSPRTRPERSIKPGEKMAPAPTRDNRLHHVPRP